MVVFRPNTLLHIEDDPDFADALADLLIGKSDIRACYGEMRYVQPRITRPTTEEMVERELARIAEEIGGGPSYVNVATAQVAKGFLERSLPACLISDTSFPLNGKRVVEWIKSHGFDDYPLIGLSGTAFDKIEPELQRWFGQSNAVYFDKGTFDYDRLVRQIVFNTEFNRGMYGNAEGQILTPSGL